MKVKQLLEFLKQCDQDADLSLTINGHFYDKLSIATQGYLDTNTNIVSNKKENNYEYFGVFLFGTKINIQGEIETDELVTFDSVLLPDLKRK